MGLIRVSLQLLNPSKPEVRGLEVSALTDSGAVNLYIPERVTQQLQLREVTARSGAA